MQSPRARAAASALPDIDDRLAPPETRYEVLDGKLVFVSPADFAHGRRHTLLDVLVEFHAAADYVVTSDQLTRTSKRDDFAPDVSVAPSAPRKDGGRRLARLAFEIVSKGSLGASGVKAAKLMERGVHRVFAIHIKRSRVLEWSQRREAWVPLDNAAVIEDRCLAVPLPVDALARSTDPTDAVVRAMIAKRHPAIRAVRARARAKGIARGIAQGRAETIIAILTSRDLAPDKSQRSLILGEQDQETLLRWTMSAATCSSVAEALRAAPQKPAPPPGSAGAAPQKHRAARRKAPQKRRAGQSKRRATGAPRARRSRA